MKSACQTVMMFLVLSAGRMCFAGADDGPARVLQNSQLALHFDGKTGTLTRLENRVAGETYRIEGDEFALQTVDRPITFGDVKLVGLDCQPNVLTARYECPGLQSEVAYTLRPADAYAEKQMWLTFEKPCGLQSVTVSRLKFVAEGLQVVCYRHPDLDLVARMVKAQYGWDFGRPSGTEPSRTFFGRTKAGGFFAGVEVPYDASELNDGNITLCYSPSLKIKAGEKLDCDAVYLGVYRRGPQDAAADNSQASIEALLQGKKKGGGFDGAAVAGLKGEKVVDQATPPATSSQVFPLPSESEAMVAMTSAILGPPRHGLKAFACAGHCQMPYDEYDSEEKLQREMKSLEVFQQCGLDGFMEPHPWGGATDKLNALREGDRFEIGPFDRRFLERARELGLAVMQFATMNNTHPWSKRGGPFRLDVPAWLRGVKGRPSLMDNVGDFKQQFANCLGCRPYCDWLEQLTTDTLATGLYQSWCIDGDFWGTGAYFHTTIPVTCTADYHDHLAPDSNYASQKALDRLVAKVRQLHPDYYLNALRPSMDLGVWALRNFDTCFTLIESGTSESNVAGGDQVRTASRIRTHHHFFPHWLDQAFVFPSYGDPTLQKVPKWPSQKIDYILLSAMSCTPNLFMSLPTKTGMPEADKQEIRKWLDWGRKNSRYLLVRKALPDWPQKGKVDGSAHIIEDSGLVFLFNPSKTALTGAFQLTEECIGLKRDGTIQISQEYPPSPLRQEYQHGQTVRWEVPPETAVILTISQGS